MAPSSPLAQRHAGETPGVLDRAAVHRPSWRFDGRQVKAAPTAVSFATSSHLLAAHSRLSVPPPVQSMWNPVPGHSAPCRGIFLRFLGHDLRYPPLVRHGNREEGAPSPSRRDETERTRGDVRQRAARVGREHLCELSRSRQGRVPRGAVAEHGGEAGDQLPHPGDQRHVARLVAREQLLREALPHRIAARPRDRGARAWRTVRRPPAIAARLSRARRSRRVEHPR